MSDIQKLQFKDTKIDFATGFFGGDFRLLKRVGLFKWWTRIHY